MNKNKKLIQLANELNLSYSGLLNRFRKYKKIKKIRPA